MYRAVLLFLMTTVAALPGPRAEGGGRAIFWKPFGKEGSYSGGYELFGLILAHDRANYVQANYTHLSHTDRYQKAAADVGRCLGIGIHAFAGVTYVDVRDNPLHFRGAGPEVGVGVKSMSLLGLTARAQLLAAIPIGRRSPKDASAETRCLPLLSWRLSVGYTVPCIPILLGGEVGYRLDYLLEFRESGSDLGFGGIYIGVKVGF